MCSEQVQTAEKCAGIKKKKKKGSIETIFFCGKDAGGMFGLTADLQGKKLVSRNGSPSSPPSVFLPSFPSNNQRDILFAHRVFFRFLAPCDISPFFSLLVPSFFSQLSAIMSGRAGGGAARKTLLAPIHFIFKLLQQRSTVSIWLYEQLAFRIEGKIRVSP